jgi:Ca2+/Na+ antiporter
LERWPYPEALVLFLVCLGVGLASPALAAVLMNLALLVVGVLTMRQGLQQGSLKRMNLGLLVVSLTILMRFFDTDLSFVLRGLVFIAVGLAFLFMNLRMLRQQKRDAHAG